MATTRHYDLPWDATSTKLQLNPFDDNSLSSNGYDTKNNIIMCLDDTRSNIVPCSNCNKGYDFENNIAICRPDSLTSLAATKSECKTCELESSRPWITGPCGMCVELNFDHDTNRCSCG